jgi:TatA/E family protein of Tat protein translocase
LFFHRGLLDAPYGEVGLTSAVPYTRLDPRWSKAAGCRESGDAMGSLGWQEILVIFVIALIVFGPRKLPELGKSLGKGLAEFKRASNELKQTWEEEVRLDKEKESISEILKDSTIKTSDILGDDSNSGGSKEIQ